MKVNHVSLLPIDYNYRLLNKKTARLFKALAKRFYSYTIICALIILASQEAAFSQLPTPSPEKPSSENVSQKQVNELIETIKKDLTSSQNTLREAQDLLIRSKENSITAREKLTTVLSLARQCYEKSRIPKLSKKADGVAFADEAALEVLEHLALIAKATEGSTLSAIADTYGNVGQWGESIESLKLAVSVYQQFLSDKDFRRLSTPLAKKIILTARNTCALMMVELGRGIDTHIEKSDQAVGWIDKGLEEFRALFGDTREVKYKLSEASALEAKGRVYGWQSRNNDKAREMFAMARDIYQSLPGEEEDAAAASEAIATYQSTNYEFKEALSNWEKAMSIYLKTGKTWRQSSVLTQIATMYWVLGNKPKIIEYTDRNLAILRGNEFTESWKKNIDTQGYKVYDELYDVLIEHTRLNNIGMSFRLREDYENSLEYYKKALIIVPSLNNPTAVRLDLRAIAHSCAKLKRWDESANFYKQALEVSRKRNFTEDQADDLQDTGWVLMEGGKYSEALQFQNEAMAKFQMVGVGESKAFSTGTSNLLIEMARSYEGLGNTKLAIFYGKRAINVIQNERRKINDLDAVAQKGFLENKGQHYRRLADWLISEGRISEAEQVLAMLKEEEAYSYVRRDDKVAEKLLQIASFDERERQALLRYSGVADKITALGKELVELERESKGYPVGKFPKQTQYEQLKKQIADATFTFQKFLEQLKSEFGEKDARLVQVDSSMQSTLKRLRASRTAVVSTIVGENRLNIIVTTAGTQRAHTFDITEKKINQLVIDFRQMLTNPASDPRPASQALYDVLVKPIEHDLTGIGAETVVWSLDGALRYIPTAALWDAEKGYLAERFEVAVLTLASRETLTLPAMRKTSWKALGVGVSKPSEGFTALTAVPAELDCIINDPVNKNLSPTPVCRTGIMNGKKLLDEKFTFDSFENSLGRYPIVHIASHFRLNPGSDKDSFLLLGGGEQKRFTVEDLRNISLVDTELIVLSACNTATPGGEKNNGIEIESFGVVAQKKGAKTVMATLWSVADESTRDFMVRFYRSYGKGTASKAAAVRQVQLSMIRGRQDSTQNNTDRGTGTVNFSKSGKEIPKGGSAPYAHPYYWAPFILIGNWK